MYTTLHCQDFLQTYPRALVQPIEPRPHLRMNGANMFARNAGWSASWLYLDLMLFLYNTIWYDDDDSQNNLQLNRYYMNGGVSSLDSDHHCAICSAILQKVTHPRSCFAYSSFCAQLYPVNSMMPASLPVLILLYCHTSSIVHHHRIVMFYELHSVDYCQWIVTSFADESWRGSLLA